MKNERGERKWFVSHNSITKKFNLYVIGPQIPHNKKSVIDNFNLVGKDRSGLEKFFYLIFSDFLFFSQTRRIKC